MLLQLLMLLLMMLPPHLLVAIVIVLIFIVTRLLLYVSLAELTPAMSNNKKLSLCRLVEMTTPRHVFNATFYTAFHIVIEFCSAARQKMPERRGTYTLHEHTHTHIFNIDFA